MASHAGRLILGTRFMLIGIFPADDRSGPGQRRHVLVAGANRSTGEVRVVQVALKRTGLNVDKARRLLLEEWQDMATLELAAYAYLPIRVDAVDLKI
jgi:hypothetical protein